MWRLLGTGVLAGCCVLGCAAAKTVPKAPAVASAKSAPSATKIATARDRLAEALRAIPRPEPVLAALSSDAQQRLQARWTSLDAERRLAVQSDDNPLVESLPLLHLASGGASPRALYALATTSVGSVELSGILGIEAAPTGSAKDAARVAVVRELARRAALNFLRDRAADVAGDGKAAAHVCRLVARAALAVERRDLVLLAREVLAREDPESTLELARELARAGELELSLERLREARSNTRPPPSAASLSATEQLIEFARAATASPTGKPDRVETLARARAWLHLGRVAEARKLLAGLESVAATRLDLAAAIAETLIERPSCPDLPLDVGSAPLCALAFRSSRNVAAARALLDRAWQSGAGRDDEAVEVYTGIAHVIPWMHETAGEIASGARKRELSAERVATLLDKLREIVVVAPHLAGLPLFLETVHSGPSLRVSGLRSDADADALSARAFALASGTSSRFTQAGVLAVAAALSHQQDISALLGVIPAEKTVSSLRVPRAALGVWAAASAGSSAGMENARNDLAEVMSEGHGDALERARLVLGVSEADALLQPSDRSYQLLSRVAGQLLSDDVPPDFALRAVLDVSGAFARGQRYEQARKILAGAASAELPPDLERARDLLQVIRGYQLVLRARAGEAPSWPEARADFARLASQPHSVAVAVWFELWSRELEALQQDSECSKKKLKSCPAATLVRRARGRGLAERLGHSGATILRRGALPTGSFDAGFRFTIEKGLEPLIIFDPNFLAVELPRAMND